nr:MAG TPA: hypothetical protein [Caudoviricetes sp.]
MLSPSNRSLYLLLHHIVVRLSLGDLDYLKFIKEQGLHFFFYNKNFRSLCVLYKLFNFVCQELF